jgi:hypothetical protein
MRKPTRLETDSCGTGLSIRQRPQRKQFFFEKRTKKPLLIEARVGSTARPKNQKFFGSFFQKRTASLYLA